MKHDTTDYVLGFRFDKGFKNVVLIQKEKPEWQKGLLNGVGGKIERGEWASDAVVREFEEETSLKTAKEDWKYFAAMSGKHFNVYCYYSIGDISEVTTTTNEHVFTVPVPNLASLRTISNIPWLVPLAIDCHTESGRVISTIYYRDIGDL